jgi:hypothetical protein
MWVMTRNVKRWNQIKSTDQGADEILSGGRDKAGKELLDLFFLVDGVISLLFVIVVLSQSQSFWSIPVLWLNVRFHMPGNGLINGTVMWSLILFSAKLDLCSKHIPFEWWYLFASWCTAFGTYSIVRFLLQWFKSMDQYFKVPLLFPQSNFKNNLKINLRIIFCTCPTSLVHLGTYVSIIRFLRMNHSIFFPSFYSFSLYCKLVQAHCY